MTLRLKSMGLLWQLKVCYNLKENNKTSVKENFEPALLNECRVLSLNLYCMKRKLSEIKGFSYTNSTAEDHPV